jgi:hypothetical protein
VSGAAMKMNPEQGTRSGFTTRCCLRPKLPGGVGVSGERMPPRPTLKATFKHQIALHGHAGYYAVLFMAVLGDLNWARPSSSEKVRPPLTASRRL